MITGKRRVTWDRDLFTNRCGYVGVDLDSHRLAFGAQALWEGERLPIVEIYFGPFMLYAGWYQLGELLSDS